MKGYPFATWFWAVLVLMFGLSYTSSNRSRQSSPTHRDFDVPRDAPPVSQVELESVDLVPAAQRSGVQEEKEETHSETASAESRTVAILDSPLSLVPEEDTDYFVPSKENFTVWLEEMKLGDVAEQAWATAGVPEAWYRIQESRALSVWCTQYQQRELDRWESHRSSVPLDVELGHVYKWLIDKSIDPIGLHEQIRGYSESVVQQIWSEGKNSENLDDSEFRWSLNAELLSLPYFAEPSQFVQMILSNLGEPR
jgi:hypothetical protein